MNDNYFRLLTIKIRNFKNIGSGEVAFHEAQRLMKGDFELDNSALLGIYGQNGSGKTAVIDALDILHEIAIAGLPKYAGGLVLKSEGQATLTFTFLYHTSSKSVLLTYSASFKPYRSNARFTHESLTVKEYEGKKWGRERVLLQGKHCGTESIVFAKNITKLLLAPDYQLTQVLKRALQTNLIIMNSHDDGEIYIDSCFTGSLEEGYVSTNLKIDLFKKNYFTVEQYQQIGELIPRNNAILTAIIPGLSVVSKATQLENEDHQTLYCVEFFTLREGNYVPLRSESQGIKRLIALLGAFLSVYNNNSVILAADEFDAGMFEYLLGDLLETFKESGRGQIIFTSHNLRILELLSHEDIIFTTIDPQNRYTRIKTIGQKKNLRDVYLRMIFLNEHNLYNPTSQYEIAKALRKAGQQ